MSGWADSEYRTAIQVGDILTIEGYYERTSPWEWVFFWRPRNGTAAPRLRQFVVTQTDPLITVEITGVSKPL